MNARRSVYCVGVVSIFAALLLAGSNAWGVVWFTNGSGTGTWEDPANWSGGVLPGPDATEIDSGLTCTLSSSQSLSNSWLMVGGDAVWGNPGGNGTLKITGSGTVLNLVPNADPSLYVGHGNNTGVAPPEGWVTVSDGAQVWAGRDNGDWWPGVQAGIWGASGHITVETGGQIISRTGISIGWGRDNGPPGAFSTLDISGAGSSVTAQRVWTVIGQDGGRGKLNMSGGTLSVPNEWLYIGHGTNAYGGSVGEATLSGGTINAAHLRVGSGGGTGSLTMNNGTLNVGGQLIVGIDGGGNGKMTVNGGAVNGGNWVVVGWNGGATGTLKITGGTMGFSDPGNSRTHLGWGGGAGHLILDGGTLKTTQIVNGGYGDLLWNGGTVQVQPRPIGNDWQTNPFLYNLNSAVIQSRGAIIDTGRSDAVIQQPLLGDPGSPGGGLIKNGNNTLVLSGANSFTGDTVVNRGTLKIGGGPAAYFSFDRATGVTVPNAGSAVNRDGTLINGASITTGGSGVFGGEALAITAQNQWLQIDNRLYLGDSQYTVAGWFKDLYSSGSWRTFCRGSAWGHQLIVEAGTQRLGSYDPDAFRPSGYDMAAGGVLTGWHHIAGVGTTGNQTKVYIDGVLVGTTDRRSYMDIFAVGNIQGGNQAFAQNIDEFYAWNRALSDTDINNLYSSGMGALSSINQPVLDPATNVKVGTDAALDLNLSREKVNSLTMTGNAAIAFSVDPNSGWGGRITTAGDMVQSGELRWNVVAGEPTLGQNFQLLAWGGARSGAFSKYTWTPLTGNKTWDITHLNVDGAVSVVKSGSDQWGKATGDSWNLPTSWTGGVIPDGTDQVATFGAAMAAPGGTVKVQGPVTVGTLQFDNAAAAYTIAGPSSVTMRVSVGGSRVDVVNGSHSITAPMTLSSPTVANVLNAGDSLAISGPIGGASGLTKSGPGTVTLSGVNNYTGGTVLNGGTLKLADPVVAGSLPAGAALIVDASDPGSLILDASGRVQSWKDTSGNGRDFTQADPARRPSVVANAMNGLPVLHMNATGSQTMINGTNFSSPTTVLYVSRQTGGTNARVLSGLSNNWLLGYHGGGKDREYFEGWVYSGAASDTNAYLFSTTIGGSGINTSVYNGGGLIASNQGGVTGPNGLALNGYTASSEFSDADVAQVVVYDHVLTDAERVSAEAYLAQKWGISMSVLPDYAPLTMIKGTLDLGTHSEVVGPTTAKGGGAVNIASTGGRLTVNGDLQIIENSALVQSGGTTRVNAPTYVGVNGSQGKLTLSGNATLDTEYLRVGQNSAAAVLTSGEFIQSGNSRVNVRNWSMDPTDIGYNTVGGGSSVAKYTISENATFHGSQFDVGVGGGADGTMVVRDNAKVSLVDWIIVGRDGGTGRLTIQDNAVVDLADGTYRANSRTHLAWGGGTAELHLNGGNLRTSQIVSQGTANTYWNGGTVTVVRRSDWGDFLTGSNNVYVGANGAKIDTNGIDAVFALPLLADPLGAPGGGLTKSGTGTLTLKQTSTYTGDTVINGGTLKLAGGPAAYYSFDRATGTTVPNAGFSPNRDGVLTNGASLTSGSGGKYGEGMAIATQSQMMLVNNAGVPLGSDWTISAWFKGLYPVGSWRTLSRGAGSDHQAIIRDSGTDLGTYTGAGFTSTGYDMSGVASGWHQITLVGSGGLTQYYIDGALVGTAAAQSTTDVYCIGNYQGAGQAWSQSLDEFYVFNRALNAADVTDLYNLGTAALKGINTPILDPATNVRIGTDGTLDVGLSHEKVASLTMVGNAAISFSIDANTNFGGITTAGPVVMSGELRWSLAAGDPAVGWSFALFDAGGAITGGFSKYTWTPLAGGKTWDITHVNVDGKVGVIASGSSKWNKSTGDSWNQPGSWAGSLIPDGVDQTASFLGAMAAPGGVVKVQGPVRVGTMEFDNASASYEIAGPSPVTMQASFGNAAINVASGSHSISAPLTLGSPTAVSVAAAPTALTIAGPISGSGGLIMSGPGTLRLSGLNTYTGGTTVNDGKLVVAAENLPATGTAVINGGALVFDQATNGIYAGQLAGIGQVNKIGAGTLTLASANSHGSTVLSAGKLDAAAPGSLGAGPVILNAGTLRVGVHADGFNGDGRGWTVNSYNISGAPFTGNALTLTDNGGSQGRTAFFNGRIPLAGAFTAQFTYTATGDHMADGMTIMLQNDPRGLSALGGLGGGMAYSGIVNSAAIALNLYPPNNPWSANSGTKVFTGGTVTPPYAATGAVNIGSGNPIQVTLNYDAAGMTLTETLVDSVAGTSFTQVLPGVDLPTILGATEAYMGFSGATGGAYATQVISNFSFSSGASSYSNDVVVPDGASPTVALAPPAANVTMGALSMGSGATLNVRPDAAAAANQAYALTMGATALAGNATFDVANNGTGAGKLVLGAIDGGAAGDLIAKKGDGTLALAGHTATMALAFPGTVRSEAGTLMVTDSLALQGATLDMHTGDLGAVDLTTGGLADVTLGGLTGTRNLVLPSGSASVGANGVSTTYSGNLTGGATLIKIGPGELTLQGHNAYSGGTDVVAGTLNISSVDALPAGRSLTIEAGGTLVLASGLSVAGAAAAQGAAPVPEPATVVLLAAGVMAGLAIWLRRWVKPGV